MEFMIGLFFVVWFFVFGFIIFTVIKGIKFNKNAPLLHVEAEVVDKQKVLHRSNDSMGHTRYYLMFKVRSGDVIKLVVPSDVFNFTFVGDTGVLAFKGTKFIEFGKE